MLCEAISDLKRALDAKIAAVPSSAGLTPPTLAVFVDYPSDDEASGDAEEERRAERAGGIVLAQAKGFELHDLMHEHVVEEGDGAVMSQQCGCCHVPATGRDVYMRRVPQSCVDMRIIIAGDKACGKSTLLAHLLTAVSNHSTSQVLQQLRLHKACFANLWVDPTAEEVQMMAAELRGEGRDAATSRSLHLMATQLALGMMHIDASELAYFLQDELPLGGAQASSGMPPYAYGSDGHSFPVCTDAGAVGEALARLHLRGSACPPQDAVVRLVELGGDGIDELMRAAMGGGGDSHPGAARSDLRAWLLRQLSGEAGDAPTVLSPSQGLGGGDGGGGSVAEVCGAHNEGAPAAARRLISRCNVSLCYFVNPLLSFGRGREGAKSLAMRLGFLVHASKRGVAEGEACMVHLFLTRSGVEGGPRLLQSFCSDLTAIATDEATSDPSWLEHMVLPSRPIPITVAAIGDLLWDEKLELLAALYAKRLGTATSGRSVPPAVRISPHWTDFFDTPATGGDSSSSSFTRPNIPAMLSFLRMLLIEHAAVLPRSVVVEAAQRAIAGVGRTMRREVGSSSASAGYNAAAIPSKELFAEVLLNPHHGDGGSAVVRDEAVGRARRIFGGRHSPAAEDISVMDVLPLTDITDMLSWLPPMLLVDAYAEACEEQTAL